MGEITTQVHYGMSILRHVVPSEHEEVLSLAQHICTTVTTQLSSDNLYKHKYEFKRTTECIKYAPYLVIHVSRLKLLTPLEQTTLNMNEEFIIAPVIVSESFSIDHSSFNLHAIVVFNGGGHYVSHFKHQGVWYLYDDVRVNDIHVFGSFENMMQGHLNPATHGVLFFYSKNQPPK